MKCRFFDAAADYLEHREALAEVFVLIDSRHEPQAIDVNFVNWLMEIDVPFSLVFTKTDKIKKGRLSSNQALFRERLGHGLPPDLPIFNTSTLKREGRADILRRIGGRLDALGFARG
ncbi:MAG: hypothetical protein AAF236_14375 [Verrucomicrobiota bacterium]